LVSTCLYIFLFKGWFFLPGTNMFPDNAQYWLFGVNPTGFGVIGAILNFIAAFLVMKITKAPPAHIQHLVEDVRIPRVGTSS
jgi:cation/acetate symporter